MRFAKYGVDMM